MDINKMINDLVEARLNARLSEMFGELEHETQIDQQVTETNSRNGAGKLSASYRQRDNGAGEAVAPARGRKRGRGRAAVGYVLKAYKGRGRRPMPDLVPTWKRAYDAIKAARGPVTAREIETVTKDKQKTVESSIYQLRSLGLVQSVKLGADGR